MSDNVVTIGGARRLEPGQPNASCVHELERLLEAARAGEIIGLAGTYVHRNQVISYSFAGAVGGFAPIGGLECVKQRLLAKATAE